MKTSRLVLAPAVAVALSGLVAAPASATTTAPTLPPDPVCAFEDAQSSNDSTNEAPVPDGSTPQATIANAQISRADIADKKKGIGFSGTGFTADNKATVTVIGTDGTKYTPETKLTVDEKGKVSGTYYFSTTEGAEVPLGKYKLFLTDLKTEKASSQVDFEVVAKDSDKDDSGKGSECEKPAAPAPSTTPAETPSNPAPSTTQPAPTPSETKEPSTAPTTPSEEPTTEAPKEAEAPKTEEPSSEAPTSPGTDDREQEPVQAQAAMVIDPTEISSEDFLNKGLKIGITGAKPGEKIDIVIEHAQGKVDRYTMSKTADGDGNATFGVQAKVKAVLGTYSVRAQAESFDKPISGDFTVVTNGTSVSNGDDSNGTDLPRTGAEMTGLALGVGLLVVGAAAVVITRRRTRNSDDPAQF